MKLVLLFAVVACAAQAGVAAQTGPASVAPVAPPAPATVPDLVAPRPLVRIVPPPTVSADAERHRTDLICRTTLATGSLIAKRKTCLTARQWEYVDQEHRDEARKLMMDNMGRPPGN